MSTLGSRPAGAQSAFFACVLLVGVAGCETVEVVEAPPEPEITGPGDIEPVEPVEPEPPSGSLIVRLHSGAAAEMPEGATATVTLAGRGARHSAELPKGERLVRFDALESGRHDLLVAVNSAGVEIGSYSYFVDVGEAMGDVTVQIDYLRADLVVEATVETSLERQYVGTASIASDTCPDSGPGRPVPSDLLLATDGDRLELTIVNFQQETLRLSGRIAPGATPLFAAGTFESTDGQSGDWELKRLTAPTPGAIAAVLEFDDRTRSCESTLEYAGLREDGSASAALGSNEAGATVEVLGHGQTRRVTLGREESVARFDGLLVGPYEVFVTLHRGGRTVESRPYSAVLAPGGANVATTFDLEWALPAASPLAAQEGRELLGGEFEGKSVVASGSSECTGSIPLVDTTRLVVSTAGSGLDMTFDSFYGKVLELAGLAGDEEGEFSASGTYRSSDGKSGSWTIGHLAAPTARSVAMLVEFSNETDSCRATYEFAGVR